eukprot:TRINITY_DN17872_c0_g1_i1.p1 TRINITY_DN17872_c0_g1~~TRINITY_DN17872_c0_g1_i1.p1  ORF type:complete len:351 (-),score=99.12 TRINITY_DN17872_c0_g1_i1:64-1116(-)
MCIRDSADPNAPASVLVPSDLISSLHRHPFKFAVTSLCDADILGVSASSVIVESLMDTALDSARGISPDEIAELRVTCATKMLKLFHLRAEWSRLMVEAGSVRADQLSVHEQHELAHKSLGRLVAEIENRPQLLPGEAELMALERAEEELSEDGGTRGNVAADVRWGSDPCHYDDCDCATIFTKLAEQDMCEQAILMTRQEVDALLTSKQIDDVTVTYSTAVDELEGRKGTGEDTHELAQLFTDFLRELMSNSVRTADSRTLGPALCVPESLLTRCLDELASNVRNFSAVRRDDIVECLNLQNGEMRERLYLLEPVSYTHLRAHETPEHLVCRLLLEKKKIKIEHELKLT